MSKRRIASIRVEKYDDEYDVTFYFDDSSEPFKSGEFTTGSLIRRVLEEIEYAIIDYNTRRPIYE